MWLLVLPQSLTLCRTLMSPDPRCLIYKKGINSTDLTCTVSTRVTVLEGVLLVWRLYNYKGLSLLFLSFIFSGPQFSPPENERMGPSDLKGALSGSKILRFHKSKQSWTAKTVWLYRRLLCDGIWYARILTAPKVTASCVYKGLWTPNAYILILKNSTGIRWEKSAFTTC